MAVVTLSNHKQFAATAETSLLDAAKAQGLVLEHSCRTGRCGACKTLVLKGETQILNPEESLDESEIDAGFILTCCRTAVNDIELGIEDLGLLASIKTQTLPCKIDQLNLLAPDVIQIFLRLPPSSQFNYLPGQYIDVIAKSGVRRSYSVANALRSDNKLELHVRAVDSGKMSQYWFNEAKTNDLLRLEGPHGTFCFHPKPEKNIVFLATGTGIAPIKSILEELSNNAELVQKKNIYIYWGGRTLADLYWQPDFANLNVAFRPTLSRTPSDWDGRVGYVQDAVIADAIALQDSVVYACGSDTMIHAAKKLLVTQGLKSNNFYSDAFVSS
ncbi:MAG: FAD-binding oxidoreductase [Pseudomonadota bacterium]|nr:FAD-binding oxidoreductase [Pseudomonadota bacterium]